MKTNGKPKDKDLLGSLAALKRAARSALATALATGTPCYILRQGKVVDIAAARQRPVRRGASR
jgi:hypothetical protein